MELIDDLQKAVEADASDLFVITGTPVSIKVMGRMVHLAEEKVMPEDAKALIMDMYERAGRDICGLFDNGDDDFSFAIPGVSRFRCKYLQTEGHLRRGRPDRQVYRSRLEAERYTRKRNRALESQARHGHRDRYGRERKVYDGSLHH